ncbi:MAG: hypothetical protein ACLU99_14930 [Alphaproteobacteria bacterium]
MENNRRICYEAGIAQVLDKMEQQAWEAWEASKTGKMRTKEKTNRGRPIKTDATDGDPEYYGYDETTVETSAGNPRFLDLLLNIQQRRAKMLRFDAPVKIGDTRIQTPGTDDDKPKYDVVKAIPDSDLVVLPSPTSCSPPNFKRQSPRKEGRNNGKANECC